MNVTLLNAATTLLATTVAVDVGCIITMVSSQRFSMEHAFMPEQNHSEWFLVRQALEVIVKLLK